MSIPLSILLPFLSLVATSQALSIPPPLNSNDAITHFKLNAGDVSRSFWCAPYLPQCTLTVTEYVPQPTVIPVRETVTVTVTASATETPVAKYDSDKQKVLKAEEKADVEEKEEMVYSIEGVGDDEPDKAVDDDLELALRKDLMLEKIRIAEIEEQQREVLRKMRQWKWEIFGRE